MTFGEIRLMLDCIRPRAFSLPVAMALCSLLAAGCDMLPPSPAGPAPTEPPVTAEPQPVAQAMPSPWDVSWLPVDAQAVAYEIDSILEGRGLSGHGAAILQYAQEYGVNPAFALAMFRKEAEFAKPESIAYRQNNPGNIVCGGGTTPLYGATGCGGRFGIYDTMADGIRAYFWLLDSEYKPGRKYNCQDIACIITIYCPPSDCDTARYIDQVVDWTVQYQSQLSAESPPILEPGPTGPSIAVTIVPATVVPESPTAAASPRAMPAAEGLIAFASDRDGFSAVYVMRADGTGVGRVTDDAADAWGPSWSPDGTRLAFVSDRDANQEIYVMNADGSAVMNLTNNPAIDVNPSWSPDGTRIAFASDRYGEFRICTMGSDGRGAICFRGGGEGDGSPSWSPDSTRIAFSAYHNRDLEIYVMNADGTGVTVLMDHHSAARSCAWSPDGTRIAFDSWYPGEHDIFVVSAEGDGATNLSNNPSVDQNPSWSPDGTQIAFQSNRDGNDEIYVMNADGTGVARLTNNSSSDGDPSWSPR